MRAAVLFAGIGGWEIACESNGVAVSWAAEWDDWKRDRYMDRWPDVTLYRDVSGLDGADLARRHGPIDILLGSPPCTDISAANHAGLGIDGEESRYYLEAIRLARETGARWIGFENSPRLRTRGADRVCTLLGDAGYAVWPCVVEAEDAGAPHARGRSYVLGCRRDAIEGADAERARLWVEQGWRGWQGRAGATEPEADADADGNRQPHGAEHAEVGGSAVTDGHARVGHGQAADAHGIHGRRGAGGRHGAQAHNGSPRALGRSDRSGLEERQGVSSDLRARLTAAERAALCPWDTTGDSLARHVSVAHGLADRLRGHGLSERAVKAELARWRSSLGDALVIPVVWAVVRAIIRTDAPLVPRP